MTGLIFHRDTMTIFARYDSVDIATRMLKNAKEKGHKLQGRKYHRVTMESLVVGTPEDHAKLDTNVEVINLMSGKPVMLKKSQQGDPVCDPSMEGYWSM